MSLRIAVLASGSGTNFQALQDACTCGYLDAEIVLVLTNRKSAGVVERAERAGVEAVFVAHKGLTSEERDERFLKEFEAHGVDFAAHAGYMRILGARYCDAMRGRAMNVHPSLLPAFTGAHPITDAWEWGVKTSGVSIHYSTLELDDGPIVLQRSVDITPEDTLESFEQKIHLVEYALFPKAIRLHAERKLTIDGRSVRVASDVEEVPWAGDLPPGLRSG